MKKLFLIIVLNICFMSIYAQNESKSDSTNKKIVVFGSSVAAGWVTSYQSQYDLQNGWALRLQRQLKPMGWEVLIAGNPGDNTKKALKKLEKDVIKVKPSIVLISLSLSNEGLNDINADTIVELFINNLKKIINTCENAGIKTIIGNCYANNDYNAYEYAAIKKANAEINKLNVATINFLGAFEDGYGKFPKGQTFDNGHPNNFGHEEMFLSIAPSIFDNILKNKSSKLMLSAENYLEIGKKKKINSLNFIPNDVTHSFSFYLEINKVKDFLITIQNQNNFSTLQITNKELIYNQQKINLVNENFKLMVTHSFALEETNIYIDGVKKLNFKEKIEPTNISFTTNSTIQCRNFAFYRACLNQDEVISMQNNNIINGSLDFFATLVGGHENLALCNSELTINQSNIAEKIKIITDKIESANIERIKTPVFEDKKAITLSKDELNKLIGTYYNEQIGDVIVFVENEKIFINTMGGNITEFLAESATKLFVKSPYEITATFDLVKNNFEINMMGQKLTVNKK